MYGTLCIRYRGFTAYRKTNDCEGIYDYLTGACGCDHEEAEDIASWAELAAIGDEYLPGDPFLEIWITE
jgi:hypothetical protein